jgi:hypothetical protein
MKIIVAGETHETRIPLYVIACPVMYCSCEKVKSPFCMPSQNHVTWRSARI